MSVEQDEIGQEVLVRPPAHPVPSLQGPFEESMVESVNEAAASEVPIDAVKRRTILLDSAYYQRVVAGRWKQKPGEKYHPLWKLVAQMSFGLHLLARNMAKSEDEVMKILQAHVDDIDGFLERTAEDFDLAQDDMQERLRCLRLPLQHGDVFDRMLEDGPFRASILDGNEKIEHIVRRTKRALKDALKDVQKGFDATNTLDKYLSNLNSAWQRESPEHEAVLVAMMGNVEGWRRAFMQLHLQGNKLAGTLKKLAEVVGEMERRAAAVSRDVVAKSRISSNQAFYPARAASAHKPLPGPPGHLSSSRASSRSTHIPDLLSNRRSGDLSSESRPPSNDSRQSGRQTPNTILSTTLDGSSRNSRDGTPRKTALPPKKSPIQEDWQNEVPIELPADIPEDVLRNAPVSAKNRLSMTLGLKPKGNPDHRISSIYYPKALGDLLKIPQSPQFRASPKIIAARGTAVRSESPLTSSDADYFSTHERSPSIGQVTPESKKLLDPGAPTPENVVSRVAVRSPTVAVEHNPQRSSVSTPALTSHTAVMQMAAPPVELSAVMDNVEHVDADRPVSRSRQESQSTLGEPGPEIAEAVPEGDTIPQANIEIVVVPSEEPKTKSEIVHELGTEPTMPQQASKAVEQANPLESAGTKAQESEVNEPVTQQEMSDPSEEHDPGDGNVEEQPEEANTAPAEVVTAPALPAAGTVATEVISEDNFDEPANEETISTFIAELEAVAVSKPTRPVTMQPSSPIELEATMPTFVLPPRSKAKLTQGKDWSSATIKDRADFFKLPSENAVIPGLKPKDFRGSHVDDPGPVRPLKLKMQKLEGKLVPVQVHTPPADQSGSPRTSRLSQDVIANLIEQISNTPKGSPTHSRAASTASSNSAQIKIERSLRSFGPPECAPAPPAPGGRSMVNPDYSNIGQFDGERKDSRKSSGGSRTSLKEKLTGSRRNSSDSSAKSGGHSSRVQSVSARGSPSDMLTSAGKDVLWFREDGKTLVGVASSS